MDLLMTRQFNGVTLDCYRNNLNSDDFWATREQIGRLLEYEYPNDSIRKIHERNQERLDKFSTSVNLTGVEGTRAVTRDVIVYNFKGLLEICRYSNQPKANAVMDFLWEIADEIRRTGSFNPKNSQLVDILAGAAFILHTAGIEGNQKALALDKIYGHHMGYSMLSASNTQLIAPQQKVLLTPTEIGQELGLTPRRVNEILAGAGYQYRIGKSWEPLEPGKPFAVMLDTGKKHSNGTPVRQLKWNSEIINVMKNFEELI